MVVVSSLVSTISLATSFAATAAARGPITPVIVVIVLLPRMNDGRVFSLLGQQGSVLGISFCVPVFEFLLALSQKGQLSLTQISVWVHHD